MATRFLSRATEVAYTFIGPKHVCAYCGDPSDTEDHTVPAWFVQGNYKLIARCMLFKVACCLDCNVRAGAVVDQNFYDRKRRIAKSLRKRHRQTLAVAHWADDELAELGGMLRKHVLSGQKRREHLMLRLQELESPLIPRGIPTSFFNNLPKMPKTDWLED